MTQLMQPWDLFLAYAAPDRSTAEELCDLIEPLKPSARVFLDSRCLLPGDDWDAEIAAAQRNALVTVVLISPATPNAYYQREEIAAAIMMARENAGGHRVVPVFLPGSSPDETAVSYGLRLKHGFTITRRLTLRDVAIRLHDLVAKVAALDTSSRPGVSTNAILLTRLINPPDGESRQESTVWLSSVGNETYVVDSIQIVHFRGQLCSMSSGALLPDADYRFSFEYGSAKTHPLMPALVLSHEDRRPVSFTLALAPAGSFPSVGGTVKVSLGYHTPSGHTGTLQLAEPSSDAVYLARLLDQDVTVKGLVVTPAGIQRGATEEPGDDRVVYKRLFDRYEMPLDYFSCEHASAAGRTFELDSHRAALNRVIENKGLLPRIVEDLKGPDELIFDLLAGLPDNQIDELLCTLGMQPALARASLRTLAVRHYLWPGEALANYILDPRLSDDQLTPSSAYVERELRGTTVHVYDDAAGWCSHANETAAVSLFRRPSGRWAAAMIRLAAKDAAVLDLLYLRREALDGAQRLEVETLCREELAERFPRESTIQFLRWLGVEPEEIRSRLRATLRGYEEWNRDAREKHVGKLARLLE